MGNTRQAKRQISLISVALWLLLAPFGVRAEDGVELNDAMKILGNASRVESGRIGYMNEESAIFKAYFLIASSQDAKSVFAKLLESLPPKARAARVYALMWAFENDKTLYDKYQHFFAQNTTIRVSSKEVIVTCTLREIEDSIESEKLKSVLYMGFFPYPKVGFLPNPKVVLGGVPTACDMKLNDAIEILGNTSTVESRLIGGVGRESAIFKAYLLIASNKNAKSVFAKILKKPSPKATKISENYSLIAPKAAVAKIYALMWAFENDKALYDKHKNFFEQEANVFIDIAHSHFINSLCKVRNDIEDEILQSSLYMDELHRGSKPPRPNNCMRAVDKLRQQGVPIPAAAK
jgi:hypothetical protein